MKNIHILPTEKPSRLVLSNNSILSIIGESNYNFSHIKSVHIYITSDDEIKGKDWYLELNLGIFRKSTDKHYLKGEFDSYKKIILTTDPDLIKDGVQAIDDEFLEWFVKNPSCEFVEVNYELGSCLNCEWNYDMCPNAEECLKNKYTIIIPKEEPKQECRWADIEQGCVRDTCKCEQKQHLIDMMEADEKINIYSESVDKLLEEKIAESENRGQKIVDYLNKYKGQSFYNDIALAIEFGYQLKLQEDENN